MSNARPVEMMVEQQARRWQLRRVDEEQQQRRRGGVIAVSRLEGAGGDEVARVLAQRLGYDLFDREIIHQIAENVHLSERVVMALDEKDRGLLAEWLVGFAADAPLTRYEYLHELRKVVGTIARHGSAVIVGRGAHLILAPQEALRVLVVAPLEVRAAQVGLAARLSQNEARRHILAAEAERRAFLAKHFQAPLGDPEWFDLVVNTHVLGIEGAADVIQAALPQSRVPLH
jgi:cytidylate kinase